MSGNQASASFSFIFTDKIFARDKQNARVKTWPKVQMKCLLFISEFERPAKIRKITVYRFLGPFSSGRIFPRGMIFSFVF